MQNGDLLLYSVARFHLSRSLLSKCYLQKQDGLKH